MRVHKTWLPEFAKLIQHLYLMYIPLAVIFKASLILVEICMQCIVRLQAFFEQQNQPRDQ
jgi:hypothetical protein